MAALMGRQVGGGRLGLGTHTWLRVAEWRDRADLSVFFFRFHSGGMDWNGEGSVKGGRKEPRQRACPLTGFFAVPVSFLWKRKKMPGCAGCGCVPHCAAWLVFWIGFLPSDSAPIIAFPRETVADSAGQDQKPKPMPI